MLFLRAAPLSTVPATPGTSMSIVFRLLALLALASITTLPLPSVYAQNGGNGGDDGDGDGDVFVFGDPIAGVDVDATGVLRVRQMDPRVAQQRLMAARAAEGADVMRQSDLRKISLQRLEAALADRLEQGRGPDDEMHSLAGLTGVDYVFFYPETGDIVIAGPAEGFVTDPTDRLVGIRSGKPVLMLEDLVTALRAYAPRQAPTRLISVSIDPTAEGLQRMQRFLTSIAGRVRPNDALRVAQGLKQNLGLQNVTIKGIPAATHFARVLVEADYRMKLVGIGLEQLPVPVKSYVARANPRMVAANAMERWYFQPNYDGISVSEDGLAMKINERRVQLVGENERVAAGGQRVQGRRPNKASQAFCGEFTEKYPQIARRVRVYAELQQLIDVAIAAAYIQESDFYGQAGWEMPVMGDETRFAVETYTAPSKVETAVNAIWKGNTLMTPLGGGVHVQPRLALQPSRLQVDSEGENVRAKQAAGPTDLADGQWWWD